MNQLKALGLVETKRAFAEGQQQLHFRIELETLITAMFKRGGPNVITNLQQLSREEDPGGKEFWQICQEIAVREGSRRLERKRKRVDKNKQKVSDKKRTS